MLNYNTNDMKHCEYIEAMRKVYSAPPPQSETSCDGYRNKYTGTPSHVCKKCAWFKEDREDV
ncbi:MAG: hypothetical protein ACLRQ0_10215 [Monoglobales bacterium]